MNKRNTHPKTINKKSILLMAAAIVIAIAGWLAVSAYYDSQKTYPLTDELEYVGKRDYGCNGFCDSAAGQTYSYATDMSPDQLVAYLKDVQFASTSKNKNWENMGSSFMIDFSHLNSKQNLSIYYHINAQNRINSFNLKQTNKQHLIDIDKEYYEIIKQSLVNK